MSALRWAVPGSIGPVDLGVLEWVGIGILAYWLVAAVLDRRGLLPEYVSVSGPLTTLHTQRGKEFLDRLAQHRRFWRAWSNVGIGVAVVVMIVAFGFLLLSAILAIRNPQPSAVSQPRNVLVIPGVNDFLPLEVAPEIIIGLLVGLVVHEGGHGLLCRVEDIEIESMGVALLALIPLGAFVEPDPASQARANRGARTRMFAAGVTNNFATTIVVFALLFGPVAGSIAVAPGASVGAVVPGGAADEAGIETGDRITSIDGTPIDDNDDLNAVLSQSDAVEHSVEVNGEYVTTVQRSLLVTSAPDGDRALGDLADGDQIVAVNGTEVQTEQALRAALAEREVATLTVNRADGGTIERTVPVGASVRAMDGGGFAAAGAPLDREAIVVRAGGQRVVSGSDLASIIDERSPGDDLAVAAYVDGERRTYEVTLGGEPENPLLGVRLSPGYSGVAVDDVGIRTYPAGGFLEMIGGDADDEEALIAPAITDSFLGKTMLSVLLPIASLTFGAEVPFNFPGFTSDVTNFYTVEGPLSFLGGGVFALANVLFWVGWLNVNLAFFNCIPAFPLDGGHILRTGTESITSRIPIDATYAMTKAVTVSVGLTMLASFLLLIFGPQLLG